MYELATFPSPRIKAQVRASSSAFWAEVLGGNGFASLMPRVLTIAYPALLTLYLTKLLPSVNHYSSGFSMA